jgi:hypothetical protein
VFVICSALRVALRDLDNDRMRGAVVDELNHPSGPATPSTVVSTPRAEPEARQAIS